MLSNDSWNDSDEIINLYSSKNIKKTFNAQLQKLLSNDIGLPKECSSNEIFESDNTSVKCSEKNNDLLTQNELYTELETPTLVTASSPKRILRRSNRLRKKTSCTFDNDVDDDDYDDVIVIQEKEFNSKKRSLKRRKAKKSKFHKTHNPEEITLDSSVDSINAFEEEELNPEVSVKVIWKSVTVKKFLIRKFQKMSRIYQELSEEENIPIRKIILTLHNSKVNLNDTPGSLNLQVYDFLEGGVLSEASNNEILLTKDINYDESSVALKFQDVNKRIIKIALQKSDKMKVGMIKFSEQLEIPLEKIKFFLDGELLNPLETPLSLGLENDDLIDVKRCDKQ